MRRVHYEARAAHPADANDPELAVERLEVQEQLLRAVRHLAEPYRSPVIQRWFEDLSPSAIGSRAVGLLATVQTRISRALAQLRRRLDRRNAGDPGAWMATWIPMLGSPTGAMGPRATLSPS